MGWTDHELFKSCAASWGLCSPGCAQWPENLHLSSALLSAFLRMCGKNSALFGPLTLHPAPLFGLGTPTNSTIVMTEWHTLLLESDILQILGGFSGMHTLNGLDGFTNVLKVNMKIWTSWSPQTTYQESPFYHLYCPFEESLHLLLWLHAKGS